MKTFSHLVGNAIVDIIRMDEEGDYDFYHPMGLFLMFDPLDGQQGLFVCRTGKDAINLSVLSYQGLYELNGGDIDQGTVLNKLKAEDELRKFIGLKITGIRLAKYVVEQITGNSFTITRGLYAGVEMKMAQHCLGFFGTQGLSLMIDERYDKELGSYIGKSSEGKFCNDRNT